MRKLSKYVLLSFFGFTCVVCAKNYIRGTTMSSDQAKKTWGNAPLDYEKFRTGDEKIRATMASSILNDKSLIGKDLKYIREKFGRPNGFYFIDAYPAYFIQVGKNHSEDTWQIVFTLNRQYRVDDIFIHKNCCDK